MSEQEAQAEAERRYPNDHYEGNLLPGAIRNARREAFEKGAMWAARHLAASGFAASQPVQVEPADDVRPFGELKESGLLWLVNRQVFHPLGFALALVVEDGRVLGWDLLGDGIEPWNFEDGTEAEHLAKVRALLRPAALGGGDHE